jgi:hypothetical protein
MKPIGSRTMNAKAATAAKKIDFAVFAHFAFRLVAR